MIFNIYNNSANEETIRLLTEFHCRNKASLEQVAEGVAHIIWVGDFNRHHPM